MRNFLTVVFTLLCLGLGLSAPACAQTANTYSGTKVWSTVPGGVSVNGALESSLTHDNWGLGAGQVKSANIGALYSSSLSQTNIAAGVYNQTQVSNSGSSNSLQVQAGQTGNTNGNTTNSGANGAASGGGSNTFNPW